MTRVTPSTITPEPNIPMPLNVLNAAVTLARPG